MPGLPPRLVEHQARIAQYLLRSRLAQVGLHPCLMRSFEYVVSAQLEEYWRIFDTTPKRIDGHHHMHLCGNVVWAKLLPAGTQVRKNFSFQSGEKGYFNRLYRNIVDRTLARRHRLTDFFFSLPPLDPPSRLRRIFSLAKSSIVEVECHPINPAEYKFLAGGEIFRWTESVPVASSFS